MELKYQLGTETNCSIKPTLYSIEQSPVAFDVLSNKLYKNSILAVIRELLTNAYDANVENGTVEEGIQVHLPESLDMTFSVRDYGKGLTDEDVMSLYTTFFKSTKSNTNNLTGCFGLGSKSPYAYTSAFQVNSYQNGVVHHYMATKSDGYPVIVPLGSESTKEEDGLEVKFNVQEEDIFKFRNEFDKYTVLMPELNIKGVDVLQSEVLLDMQLNGYKLSILKGYGIYIKQGQNFFNIHELMLNTLDVKNYVEHLQTKHPLLALSMHFQFVLTFPIGTFDIPPSRESLSESKNNMDIIRTIRNEIDSDWLTNLMKDNIHLIIENVDTHSREMIKNGNRTEVCTVCRDILNQTYGTYELDVTYGNVHTKYYHSVTIGCINSRYDKTCMFVEKGDNVAIVFTKKKSVSNIIKRWKANNHTSTMKVYFMHLEKGINKYDLKKYIKCLHDLACISKHPELGINIQFMQEKEFFKQYPMPNKIVKTESEILQTETTYSAIECDLNRNGRFYQFTDTSANVQSLDYYLFYKNHPFIVSDYNYAWYQEHLPLNTLIELYDSKHIQPFRYFLWQKLNMTNPCFVFIAKQYWTRFLHIPKIALTKLVEEFFKTYKSSKVYLSYSNSNTCYLRDTMNCITKDSVSSNITRIYNQYKRYMECFNPLCYSQYDQLSKYAVLNPRFILINNKDQQLPFSSFKTFAISHTAKSKPIKTSRRKHDLLY